MKQYFLTYKNSTISFSSEGKGNAIILLHGFLEESSMWAKIAPELLKRNRVICIDLLGHGNSDCISYTHSMLAMADAVKFVLNYLRIRRATFIGHSMGGYVALAFADKYLKNVKGICLLNSTSQADDQQRKKVRLRAVAMAKINFEGLISMSINNLFTKETFNQFSEEIKRVKTKSLKVSLQSYIACSEGMRLRDNTEHILKSAEFKKLMIIGEKDTILQKELLIDEVKRTNTPFVQLSGGHMSHIENLPELLVVLKKFIRD